MLPARLAALTKWVSPNSIVADIGTDHGYLAIALVQQQLARHVYAIDNKNGPLKRAELNIAQAKLTDYITCLKSDGLTALPFLVDVIILAGMGINTMLAILKAEPAKYQASQLIIVETKGNLYEFRKWLNELQYPIIAEDLVDERHYYHSLAFSPQPQSALICNELDLVFGPKLRKSNSAVFQAYLAKQAQHYTDLYAKHGLIKHQKQLALIQKQQALL